MFCSKALFQNAFYSPNRMTSVYPLAKVLYLSLGIKVIFSDIGHELYVFSMATEKSNIVSLDSSFSPKPCLHAFWIPFFSPTFIPSHPYMSVEVLLNITAKVRTINIGERFRKSVIWLWFSPVRMISSE